MTTTVTIWSDIHCPWAAVVIHRLRTARDQGGFDVVFDQRPWPLELVNGGGVPYNIVSAEAVVLSNHEPELFSSYTGNSRPSTFLPSFELVAAARRVGGSRAAEEVDYQLRLAFFRHAIDVSIRAGLTYAANAAEANDVLDAEKVMTVWDQGDVRGDVLTDYQRSKDLPIQGSPQIFWPDGTTSHNPGMTDHEWVRGLPRIFHSDPEEPARLLGHHLPRLR